MAAIHAANGSEAGCVVEEKWRAYPFFKGTSEALDLELCVVLNCLKAFRTKFFLFLEEIVGCSCENGFVMVCPFC